MAIARHTTGPGGTLQALASQVHPVFMLPPLAVSLFGAVLAGGFDPALALLHAAAMFFAVYTAHVKDGLVDFHYRDEDDDHPLTRRGCWLGLLAAGVGFALTLVAIFSTAGGLAAALTLPTWAIGYLHAPQLDTNPVTATLGYPVGIGLCLTGGYAVQTATITPRSAAFAAVFVTVLAGVKVIDDTTDYGYDRSIDKRTVAVVVGPKSARSIAYALMGAGLLGVIWLTVEGLFPPGAPTGVLAFGLVAGVAARKDAKTATMLLVRGAYLLLAALVLVVFFRPFAGVPLPDITVLGPYTYLATEVVFGTVALVLLVRADAIRSATRTIAAVYPIAYVWDWYTLEVGVFAIPMRTGIEVFGIPLEEHLFMFVVPALVLGIHETVNRD